VIDRAFFGGLLAYGAGAVAGLIAPRRSVWPRVLCCGLALFGGLLELCASILSLASGAHAHWEIPAGVPFLAYGFRLDALSSYFILILSLLAVTISIYSLGYLRAFEEKKTVGLLGFFYNVLLASLTAVFTASNAFFFLIAWEAMALSSYCLVSFHHREESTRSAGVLYFVMSHAGTGCLLAGFLLLSARVGSLEFSDFASGRAELTGPWQAAIFLLFFAGFGVKAGIIPLHIWLPEAHPVAPSNISALMSGIVIKCGIYGMARVFFEFWGCHLYGPESRF